MARSKRIGNFIYVWEFYTPYNKGNKKWRALTIESIGIHPEKFGYGYGYSSKEAREMAFSSLKDFK